MKIEQFLSPQKIAWLQNALALVLELGFCLLKIFTIIVPLLLCVAYLTYAERRIIGLMQLRRGPNVVGPFGLLQPIADAIKLLSKELILPTKADHFLFLLAPVITFCLSLIGWAVMPFDKNFVLANINVGLLYVLAVSSLGVYGVIIAGWASNSKYAFFGAIRSSAQMISYEIAMGVAIVCVVLGSGSLNLIDIIEVQKTRPFYMDLLLTPLSLIFFIAALAETNRHPFDLPEAESELVAGYNVEYSSMTFAMFFLGEYANMIMVSAMTTVLFFGGYLPPFNISFGFLRCDFVLIKLYQELMLLKLF
jgi:NADH-quinone oxidoreductase subunit H